MMMMRMMMMMIINFRRITHCFRDTSCYNAENHILPTPLVFDLELLSCWNVEMKFGARKLESWGLLLLLLLL